MVSGSGCRQSIEQIYHAMESLALSRSLWYNHWRSFWLWKKDSMYWIDQKFIQAFLYDVMAELGSQVPWAIFQRKAHASADGYSSLIILAHPGFRSGSEKVRSSVQRVNPAPLGMCKPGARLNLNAACCLRDHQVLKPKIKRPDKDYWRFTF